MQINPTTATVDNATLTHGKVLNINTGTVFFNDTLYTLNYSFGDIRLSCYDRHLQPVGVVPLAKGGGQSIATSIAIYGRNVWIGTRAHGGTDFMIGNQTIVAPAPLWYATLSGWKMRDGMLSGIDIPTVTIDKAKKVIIDGRLYIRRGEQLFNALGQPL